MIDASISDSKPLPRPSSTPDTAGSGALVETGVVRRFARHRFRELRRSRQPHCVFTPPSTGAGRSGAPHRRPARIQFVYFTDSAARLRIASKPRDSFDAGTPGGQPIPELRHQTSQRHYPPLTSRDDPLRGIAIDPFSVDHGYHGPLHRSLSHIAVQSSPTWRVGQLCQESDRRTEKHSTCGPCA